MHIPKTLVDVPRDRSSSFVWPVLVFAAAVSAGVFVTLVPFSLSLTVFIIVLSIVMSTQSAFTLIWMLYAWEDATYAKSHRSPETYLDPKFSFTALIPARHETGVIADTIAAVSQIRYPDALKEILVLCRSDDVSTIAHAQKAIDTLHATNVRVVVFDSDPINKPHALNIGLANARNDVIAVFDAEDEPHADIFHVVNTMLQRDGADVVQCGVQLMNYRSRWFCAQAALEYFFWFKSGLHFFSRVGGIAPLGGNTVFMKKSYLEKVDGWNEACLTEDAEIGFRLAQAGAKIRVTYDERHVTKEESPTGLHGLIKQRTRWNQGFLQILAKGDWRYLPNVMQKVMVLYILLSPIFHGFMLFYVPFAIWVAMTQKLSLIISLFSFMPLFLFIGQMLVFGVGMFEFTKAYKLPCSVGIVASTFATYLPYQGILILSSIRAMSRFMLGKNGWEKTLHTNDHRTVEPTVATVYE